MKKSLPLLLIFFATQLFATNGFAQAVSLADANKLFDFAEAFDPELFAPPADTQQLNAVDSDWFLRFFSNYEIILAVNTNGTGPFFAGQVYALGGPFDEPFFVGILADLVAFIDSLSADDDEDGVINSEDQCAGTPTGEPVNAQGCSASQLDDDGDGVSNALDQCPATPTGEAVNGAGCSDTELDDDNDGVSNAADQCPATPAGEPVTAAGCSAVQLGIVVTQADADKLFNFAEALDATAFSPPALTQTVSQQSSNWYVRTYTNTGISIKVSINGTGTFFAGNVYVVGGPFGDEELFIDTLANLVAFINSLPAPDDDNDGVANTVDLCPDTPTGEVVNAQGCSASQQDDDFDGVNNATDQCPGTPYGEPADAQGCSASQLDDDNDGVNNALDQCPDTPAGESVNAQGCSASQAPPAALLACTETGLSQLETFLQGFYVVSGLLDKRPTPPEGFNYTVVNEGSANFAFELELLDDGVPNETSVSGDVSAAPTVNLLAGLQRNQAAMAAWSWERSSEVVGTGTFSLVQLSFDETLTSYRVTLSGTTNPMIAAGPDCGLEVTSLGNGIRLTFAGGFAGLTSSLIEFQVSLADDSLTGLLSAAGGTDQASVTLTRDGAGASCTFDLATKELTCP